MARLEFKLYVEIQPVLLHFFSHIYIPNLLQPLKQMVFVCFTFIFIIVQQNKKRCYPQLQCMHFKLIVFPICCSLTFVFLCFFSLFFFLFSFKVFNVEIPSEMYLSKVHFRSR